jgi:hypothetical protein
MSYGSYFFARIWQRGIWFACVLLWHPRVVYFTIKMLIIRWTTGHLTTYYIRTFESSSYVLVNAKCQVGVHSISRSTFVSFAIWFWNWSQSETAAVVENWSYRRKNCTGFSCRPSRNIGWSCPTVSNVGTGIQKWKSAHSRRASQWTWCVRSHGRVGGRDWTDHGWRQALESKGISWWNGDLWVQSAPKITRELKLHRIAAKGCRIIWRATVDALRNVSIWNDLVAKGNMLDQINAIDETWVRSYHPKLKRQSSEWRHTHRNNAGFDKISYPWSWWSLWTTCKVFLCVPVPQGQDCKCTVWRAVSTVPPTSCS